MYGNGVFNRVKQFFKGKDNKLPIHFRKTLEAYKDQHIGRLLICRVPLNKTFTILGNLVSNGEYEKKIDSLNYDDMFHLYLLVGLDDGTHLKLEKNQTPELKKSSHVVNNDTECVPVDLGHKDILLQDFIDRTINKMGIDNYTHYNYKNLNCQNFVLMHLVANGLIRPSYKNFIMQDVDEVASSIPGWADKLINFATNLADRADVLVHGGAVQSVVFHKDKYSKAKAKKWLKEHNFKHYGVDEKENTLRYRQENPKKYKKYYTKTVEPDVLYIIGY